MVVSHCPVRSHSKNEAGGETLPRLPRKRSRWQGYKSAAPNTAPHAARAMPVHARVSAIHGPAIAALDGRELDEDVCEADEPGEVDEGDDVDGAAVEAKESVVLSSAQNCCASFSAEGTFVLQLATTQLYSASGNVLLVEWWVMVRFRAQSGGVFFFSVQGRRESMRRTEWCSSNRLR